MSDFKGFAFEHCQLLFPFLNRDDLNRLACVSTQWFVYAYNQYSGINLSLNTSGTQNMKQQKKFEKIPTPQKPRKQKTLNHALMPYKKNG